MSLAKVIEVMGEGSTMEEAVENIVKEASKTVHNIKSIYMENIQAIVEDNRVDHYRIDAKVTFLLEE
ncbi:dodecin family protein [Fodinibius halophilus]|uniref:Dodecin domain-containing protein n=1 Tax=Fodinibius halophilus TaxID=1736908 RepID=A0A6M1T8W6_9BACT|nr:dodecin family protein [Fodinibius halophilus]NGP89875.1 dodecin domain-containing protein [Fodinibius halophilus]